MFDGKLDLMYAQVESLRSELRDRYFADDPYIAEVRAETSDLQFQAHDPEGLKLSGPFSAETIVLDGLYKVRGIKNDVWRDRGRGIDSWQIDAVTLCLAMPNENSEDVDFRAVYLTPDKLTKLGQAATGKSFGPIHYNPKPLYQYSPRRIVKTTSPDTSAYTAPRQFYSVPTIGRQVRRAVKATRRVLDDLF